MPYKWTERNVELIRGDINPDSIVTLKKCRLLLVLYLQDQGVVED